jgi:hypothetical protein
MDNLLHHTEGIYFDLDKIVLGKHLDHKRLVWMVYEMVVVGMMDKMVMVDMMDKMVMVDMMDLIFDIVPI